MESWHTLNSTLAHAKDAAADAANSFSFDRMRTNQPKGQQKREKNLNKSEFLSKVRAANAQCSMHRHPPTNPSAKWQTEIMKASTLLVIFRR